MRRAVGVAALAVAAAAAPFVDGAVPVGAQSDLAAEVRPAAAAPGEGFTVTMTGCVGGSVVAGLFVPFAADPVRSTGPLSSTGEPVVGTIIVPEGAAPEADASIVVTCSDDADAFVELPVRIVAVEGEGGSPPPAVPAPPVSSAPRFTG